jgi:hypothetical protein
MEAIVETESSGREVDTDRRINPAAISDKPKAFDRVNVYRIILSLKIAMKNNDVSKIGKLSQIIWHHKFHFLNSLSIFILFSFLDM